MTTVLSTKGQIVIPNEIRERKGLRPGDELELHETGDAIVIRKKHRNEGLIDYLLACPVKGFRIPKMKGKLQPAKFDVPG